MAQAPRDLLPLPGQFLSQVLDVILMARKQKCVICGEYGDPDSPILPSEQLAEMADPKNPEEDSVIVHPECGLNAGLEVA